jgi:hypothetical protein
MGGDSGKVAEVKEVFKKEKAYKKGPAVHSGAFRLTLVD